jgi:hypothetical protein
LKINTAKVESRPCADCPTEFSLDLNLRDYFAAQVMAEMFKDVRAYNDFESLATCCYLAADAMIKAREKDYDITGK